VSLVFAGLSVDSLRIDASSLHSRFAVYRVAGIKPNFRDLNSILAMKDACSTPYNLVDNNKYNTPASIGATPALPAILLLGFDQAVFRDASFSDNALSAANTSVHLVSSAAASLAPVHALVLAFDSVLRFSNNYVTNNSVVFLLAFNSTVALTNCVIQDNVPIVLLPEDTSVQTPLPVIHFNGCISVVDSCSFIGSIGGAIAVTHASSPSALAAMNSTFESNCGIQEAAVLRLVATKATVTTESQLLLFHNCQFISNSFVGIGGVFSLKTGRKNATAGQVRMWLQQSHFVNNEANGAVVGNFDGPDVSVEVSESVFVRNRVYMNGIGAGVFKVTSSLLRVVACVFRSNYANLHGGVLIIHNSATSFVIGSNFSLNSGM
jgi:hypothetical protein